MDMQASEIELPGALRRIGIEAPEHALLVAPVSFRDCTEPITILPVANTGKCEFICLTVERLEFFRRDRSQCAADDKRVAMVRAIGLDELGGEAPILAYQAIDLWAQVRVGDNVHLYGEYSTMEQDPIKRFYDPLLIADEQVGRVIPVYKGKQGLVGAEAVETGVHLAKGHLVKAGDYLLEKTGLSIRAFKGACGLTPTQLLADLHWPETMQRAVLAMAAARAVSLRAIQEQVLRQQERIEMAESALPIDRDGAVVMIKDTIKRFPFTFTQDQKRAVWEIVQDLISPRVMRRMLSGDVGTGKTATFFVPAVMAYRLGWHVAILAPNRLLVGQIASELSATFPEIPVHQVVSGVKLAPGAFDVPGIFIGTTALVMAAQTAGRTFKFLISDEQQKFSIDQRNALLAPEGNLLESTATAIPRTIALVSLGGLDVSELKTCPVHKEIHNAIITKKKAKMVFDLLKHLIAQGGQVAVIYPLAEDNSDKKTRNAGKGGGIDPNRSVEAAMTRFAEHFGERVGLIHGKLKASEKDATIARMKNREIDVLISSTVIEIGITLPSLQGVVVVNPERFGVSQLHQLRGRLVRHGGKGYFVMLDLDGALAPESEALKRMSLLVKHGNGFDLAVSDAEMRGAGDVFDEYGQQSGVTRGIFFGIELTYSDVDRAMEHRALQGARNLLPLAIGDA